MSIRKLPQQEARWPPPAFQFYASDTLASQVFKRATLAERGLLLTMLAEIWVNDGVPADTTLLALTLGIRAQDVESARGALIEAFFREAAQTEGEERQLFSPELLKQKQHLIERRKKLRAAGQKGGRTTQARERKGESREAGLGSGLGASLKPLSRVEKSRKEGFQGGAMDEKEHNGAAPQDPWVRDFDS